MDAFSLSLWPDDQRARWEIRPARARLEVYPARTPATGEAVLILPGGGYGRTSLDEGCKVARALSERGVSAGVCLYRVAPDRYPAPLVDGCRAVRLFRAQATRCGFAADRVTLLGFSAGGHLAGLIASEAEHDDPVGDVPGSLDHRPDRLALIYPLVSLVGLTHPASIRNLFGELPDRVQSEALSVERRVDASFPAPFLVHAADDPVIPAQHSVDLAARCLTFGLSPELHLVPTGGHGFAAAPLDGFAWLDRFVNWLQQ